MCYLLTYNRVKVLVDYLAKGTQPAQGNPYNNTPAISFERRDIRRDKTTKNDHSLNYSLRFNARGTIFCQKYCCTKRAVPNVSRTRLLPLR